MANSLVSCFMTHGVEYCAVGIEYAVIGPMVLCPSVLVLALVLIWFGLSKV